MPISKQQATNVLRRILPKLSANHKGSHGRIGVLGGGKFFAGAPYFASISAMRAGADLAYVICSSHANNAIKAYSPDLIVMPVLDHVDEKEFENQIESILEPLHALVVGPGLGREQLIQNRAIKLINAAKKRSLPIVIDADGLMLVNQDPSLISSYPKAVLTPNIIELQRLWNSLVSSKDNCDIKSINQSDIVEYAKSCAKKLNVTILSKGPQDIICAPRDGFYLATDSQLGSKRRCGGQGDILSGITSVFLHWIEMAKRAGEDIDHSYAWASYFAANIVRYTNQLAFAEKGYSFLCSDMVDKLNKAMTWLTSEFKVDADNEVEKIAEYAGELSQNEINRYQRQMLVDSIGPAGQIKLKKTSVLIIGAGGLGCPSAIYLAAAGVGKIGIVDDDHVEESNLHRQILHNVHRVGQLKVDSIKKSLLDINPNVICETYPVRLTRFNAVDIIEQFDIILDASDNLPTRYMINDACVIAKKPLVSGAALRTDGQLTVYNYDEKTPCFRCLFPIPPNPGAVGSCSEEGVLGPIPGVIGVLQAFEVIKLASELKPSYAGHLLTFSGLQGEFRKLKVGSKRPDCVACSPSSGLTRELIDYNEFCKISSCAKLEPQSFIPESWRVSLQEYRDILANNEPHLLIDVRPESHSKASRFAHAISIPLASLISREHEDLKKLLVEAMDEKKTKKIFVVCRRGIASQKGAAYIVDLMSDSCPDLEVKDIIGGMTGWAKLIDKKYSCV